MGQHFVYILASKKRGTLYIGFTNNLHRRIFEHKQHILPGFTQKYNVTQLVHIEQFSMAVDAIAREKRLKTWNRDWKIDLIETHNPEWQDLSTDLINF